MIALRRRWSSLGEAKSSKTNPKPLSSSQKIRIAKGYQTQKKSIDVRMMTVCKMILGAEVQSIIDEKVTDQEIKSVRLHLLIPHLPTNEGTTLAEYAESRMTSLRHPISIVMKKAKVGDVIVKTKSIVASTNTEGNTLGGTDTREMVKATIGMKITSIDVTDIADIGIMIDRQSRGWRKITTLMKS